MLFGIGFGLIAATTSVLRLGVDYWGTACTAFMIFAALASYYCDDISDLDLSYTPPLGSPWDAVPPLAQSWAKAVRLQTRTWYSVRAAVMRMNLGGLVRCA